MQGAADNDATGKWRNTIIEELKEAQITTKQA
jgi:hypothetical protein